MASLLASTMVRPALPKEITTALKHLEHWMSLSQRRVLREGLDGEEWQFFAETALRLATVTLKMPQVYQQDGLGDQAIAHLHYFRGGADWYITERDTTKEQIQAFGLANLFGDGGELGYIGIAELIAHGVELDWHWKPLTLADLRAKKGW